MLTVHHLGISQSDRIVWLCEELEIPYEFIRYERDPVTRMAPANYKALHPFGTAPVITDGDLVLGESGAIIEYICQRHGGGRLVLAPDHPDYAEYLFWYHFANASLMPAALIDFVLNSLGDVVQPGTMALLRERGDTAHAMMEAHLAKNTWFAGDEFSAADVIMVFPLTTMRMFAPRDLAPYPNILAYLQRVGARPAFQRAMAKADPDLPPMLT
jgi:glutathione S-transferase